MTSVLAISAGQYSETGIKGVNEDAYGIYVPAPPSLDTKGIAAVIADGVSSSAAGREAAECCVQGFINDYYSTPESWTVKTSGRKVLGALNHWLYGRGQSIHGSSQGMLTTVSVIIIKSATAHLFHVGDTRIHLLRDGKLERLTRDHRTWATEKKTFLSRAMGADIVIEIDYQSLPVELGDVFILTTDGVHDYVDNRTMVELYRANAKQPERAVRKIAARALENGSHDNVTCQALRLESLSRQNEEEFSRQLSELPFPPPLEPGQILDGYRILRELHASKRTQVYLAVDTESGDKVIIKTPSVNFQDDPEYIDGFLHEEWAGRRIHSPHVLKVLEPKRRRRFLYYVTEYVEGQTLEQWINDKPLADITEVRPIAEQIVAGVRAFHRQEMIHQDLKPGNILIDNHGTVKIIDFGSTRIAGIHEICTPVERGRLLGTYDYAAPEYFDGYPGTECSDLYSIGVIVYEMLTGKLPYGGPLSRRALKRVRYVPVKRINPAVPLWVDRALEKAVHLNPKLRYSAMSEFMTDLTRPNPALIKQNQPLLERNPVAFWQTMTIVLLILNLIMAYLLLGRE